MRRRQRKLIKQINEANRVLLQQWRAGQQTKEDLKNVGIQVDQLEPMEPLQPSLLQLLLASESLTDAEICAELNNCNYLGYLLCSSTLCFALVHIARHPSVQQRCLEELQADPAGELPYLQAVLQETLRLHPPQLIVGRQLAQDFPYSRLLYVPQFLLVSYIPFYFPPTALCCGRCRLTARRRRDLH